MWRHAAALTALMLGGLAAAQDTRIERGRYLLHAGGCITCHTDEDSGSAPLAGGRRLETPFGVFFAPNITPDRETGIGNWSDDDFVDAFWLGVSPQGDHYYPAFPYPAYTGISREDLLAIKAYLFSLPPITQTKRSHELPWYLASRLVVGIWKLLYFSAGRFVPDTLAGRDWNRGAYLVRHLGHCGECHTPRNLLGAVQTDRELAGNRAGPDGEPVPDITPDREAGIGKWSPSEIEFFLEIGMLPDGDFVGGAMSPVIDDNTGKLTPEDRKAIAVYLKSLPASGSLAQ